MKWASPGRWQIGSYSWPMAKLSRSTSRKSSSNIRSTNARGCSCARFCIEKQTLTPDQAKNWPQFEQAVRDLVQLRIQRVQALQASDQQQPVPPFERLQRRADDMAKTSAALKKIADAGTPLYQSLNDDQKNRFGMLARMLGPHHGMRGRHDRG